MPHAWLIFLPPSLLLHRQVAYGGLLTAKGLIEFEQKILDKVIKFPIPEEDLAMEQKLDALKGRPASAMLHN
jgi:hypothetical protein